MLFILAKSTEGKNGYALSGSNKQEGTVNICTYTERKMFVWLRDNMVSIFVCTCVFLQRLHIHPLGIISSILILFFAKGILFHAVNNRRYVFPRETLMTGHACLTFLLSVHYLNQSKL